LVWLVTSVLVICIVVNKTDRNDFGIEFTGLDGQKILSLTPEKWIGKKFPLTPYIDESIGESSEILSRMSSGLWTVVLYRPNCPKCQQLLSNLSGRKMMNVVYLEVPLDKKTEMFQGNYMRLDNKKNWFCQPPLLVQTNNGLVTKIYITDEQIDVYLSSVYQ
jgi:hypothetical protein